MFYSTLIRFMTTLFIKRMTTLFINISTKLKYFYKEFKALTGGLQKWKVCDSNPI